MINQEYILNQQVIVNQQLQEEIQYEQLEFPVIRFIDQMDYFADNSFLCHWHTEFELAVVLQGSVEYWLDQNIFHISAGDGIFINSQILHSAHQLTSGSVIFNILFPPTLLTPSVHLLCTRNILALFP
ncbi:MAG: cupin domain-containing protein [Acetivibrionales bacterium]